MGVFVHVLFNLFLLGVSSVLHLHQRILVAWGQRLMGGCLRHVMFLACCGFCRRLPRVAFRVLVFVCGVCQGFVWGYYLVCVSLFFLVIFGWAFFGCGCWDMCYIVYLFRGEFYSFVRVACLRYCSISSILVRCFRCFYVAFPYLIPYYFGMGVGVLSRHVNVGQVYTSCLIPRWCSSRIAVEYFALQYGKSTGSRATGPQVLLCALAWYLVRFSWFASVLLQFPMLHFQSCSSGCHLMISSCPHTVGLFLSCGLLVLRCEFCVVFVAIGLVAWFAMDVYLCHFPGSVFQVGVYGLC